MVYSAVTNTKRLSLNYARSSDKRNQISKENNHYGLNTSEGLREMAKWDGIQKGIMFHSRAKKKNPPIFLCW